VTLELRLIYKR